ncbi:hypothetical protein AVEN_216155-1 [Araneus ventricosus]|uniref:Tc1-like transposase DDE domain-containing protein n=1 Tax=Araneus ventricosus TaxID=182803 RepID=A0A4Y2I913_ARAVE|nr:hypothetical protein AVEN_216155-1 [Araneus ventricosus]
MVWAGITLSGETDLHVLHKGNKEMPYAEVIGEEFVLLVDNARPHRVGMIEEYFEDQEPEQVGELYGDGGGLTTDDPHHPVERAVPECGDGAVRAAELSFVVGVVAGDEAFDEVQALLESVGGRVAAVQCQHTQPDARQYVGVGVDLLDGEQQRLQLMDAFVLHKESEKIQPETAMHDKSICLLSRIRSVQGESLIVMKNVAQ